MIRGLTLILALGTMGCDLVFPLATPDGGSDGAIDAPACWNPALGGDEDGDGQVNGCDACPADLPSSNQVDMDGDGVGDRCDPQPALAKETIRVFDGFDAETDWVAETGKWGYQPGSLVATGTDEGADEPARIELPIPSQPRTGLVVVFELGSEAVTTGAYLMTDSGRTGCFYVPPKRIDLVADGITQFTESEDLATPGRMRLAMDQDADGVIRCRGQRGDTAEVVASSTPVAQRMATTLGLWAESTGDSDASAFHSAMIVTSAP